MKLLLLCSQSLQHHINQENTRKKLVQTKTFQVRFLLPPNCFIRANSYNFFRVSDLINRLKRETRMKVILILGQSEKEGPKNQVFRLSVFFHRPDHSSEIRGREDKEIQFPKNLLSEWFPVLSRFVKVRWPTKIDQRPSCSVQLPS